MRYDKAQICLNGHVISSSSTNVEKYCSICGSETIDKCPNCDIPIRGNENIPGVIVVYKYNVPSYCYNCGNPFPWTKSKLEALQELIDFDDQLSSDEKLFMHDNVKSLTVDVPRTKVVATKFSIFLKKAGVATSSAIRDILVDIVSESAKKIIFGQ